MYSRKRKLLIIEDERVDYSNVIKVFTDNTWDILPNSVNEFFKWKNILNSQNEKTIIEHYGSIIGENFNDIGLIILDISLFSNHDRTGKKILEMIRMQNPTGSYKLNNWSKKVPIIALTKHDDDETMESVFGGKDSVDYYFNKESTFQNPLKLLLTAEVAYTNFCIRMSERPIEDIFKSFNTRIDQVNLGIAAHFQDLKSYLDPKFSDLEIIKSNTSLLICQQFKNMSHDKAEKFFTEYSHELSSLSPKYQLKIQEYFKDPKFKEQFVESLRNGDITAFTDLLDKLYLRLEDSGVISSLPIVKFVLPGILALLKIISQHKD